MNFESFKKSIAGDTPPADLSNALQALWTESAGDWHGAHALVQHSDHSNDCWVHAYLHRVEGDLNNASYWYGRAGKEVPHLSTREEWAQIAKALL